MAREVTIGIAQFSPVHLNLSACMDKIESIMAEARRNKVELLALGETWLSGYPAWIDHCKNVAEWDNADVKAVFQKFYLSSVTIDGPEVSRIRQLARDGRHTVVLGINERVERGPGNGTVYNSVITVGSNGDLLNHHRKLVPTFTEKMLYGHGDGHGLKAVDTSFGRVGASICWEHWMPLTRQALHDSGEHIHVALWPNVHEMLQLASRHYAFEGRCFVVAVGQTMKASDFPSGLELPARLYANPDQWVLRGGSCVIDPSGQFVVAPLMDREELIVCRVDTDSVYRERMTLDVSGHYQRPDVFDFRVKTERS
ncbi:MAG: carbon-nitrogen hydrolase family protein [Cyclobacteriaceae bacterium]